MKRILVLALGVMISAGAFAAERTHPVATKKVPPVYTKAIRDKHLSGVVTVSFVVAEDGSVEDVKATKSPAPELSEAAEACVKKWKFRSATENGKPVRTRMQMPIVFGPRG